MTTLEEDRAVPSPMSSICLDRYQRGYNRLNDQPVWLCYNKLSINFLFCDYIQYSTPLQIANASIKCDMKWNYLSDAMGSGMLWYIMSRLSLQNKNRKRSIFRVKLKVAASNMSNMTCITVCQHMVTQVSEDGFRSVTLHTHGWRFLSIFGVTSEIEILPQNIIWISVIYDTLLASGGAYVALSELCQAVEGSMEKSRGVCKRDNAVLLGVKCIGWRETSLSNSPKRLEDR